jgi:hypothetical protein
MPLQNRVTPDGEIIATSARGTVLGNRGILHDENKQIVRQSRTTMWLICRLEFNGRRQELMNPKRYTQLFFLDEAVALAAGHRPCGECRRKHYRAYIDAVNVQNENPIGGATDLDKQLNASRKAPRTIAAIASLPDGVFVDLGDNDFRLIWDGALHRWSPEGYVDPIAIVDVDVAAAVVVTSALSVAALRHGYEVAVHPSASPSPPESSLPATIHTPQSEPMMPTVSEELLMSEPTPDQTDEIKQILRTSAFARLLGSNGPDD